MKNILLRERQKMKIELTTINEVQNSVTKADVVDQNTEFFH